MNDGGRGHQTNVREDLVVAERYSARGVCSTHSIGTNSIFDLAVTVRADRDFLE